MNYGFNPHQPQQPQDDVMKKLMALLNDTGYAGLQGLLGRLFGVAPTEEGQGFGSFGGLGGGGALGGGSSGGSTSSGGGKVLQVSDGPGSGP